MSEREAELGYPSTTTRNQHGSERSMSFSLPSLSQINLPRPESSLPANLDKLRLSQAKPLSPILKETVVKDDSQTEKASPSSQDESLLTTGGTSLPVPESMSSPSPLFTFSTWVPDDSLRFIKPHYLSLAEKETLQQQTTVKTLCAERGKRKECEDDDAENEGDQVSRNKKDEGCKKGDEERPKKMGRPLPLAPDDSPTASLPLPSREPSSRFSAFLQRTHSQPTLPVPSSSSRPDEMDLLRQVRSNNLSLPTGPPTQPIPAKMYGSINWQPPRPPPYANPYHQHLKPVYQYPQHQHHHPYHHPHQQRQNQYHQQNDLFTYAPLYHPPPASSYIYRPDPKPNPNPRPKSNTTRPEPTHESTEIHARDRNFSPTSTTIPHPSATISSPCAQVPSPIVEPASIGSLAALELPHGDWRRRYVGRGRGQSGS